MDNELFEYVEAKVKEIAAAPSASAATKQACKDFEDAIRNAISIGGDSDTIAAIAGSLAEACYGIPGGLREAAVQPSTRHCRSL